MHRVAKREILRPKAHMARVYEPKGMRTDTYRIKRRLMEALYPEVEFIEVRR